MKRLGTVIILSSVCLLAACGSEIEMVHNETYNGQPVVTEPSNEEKYMEKPTNDETTDTETTENSKVTVENKDESKNSVREELMKRAEANKEKKESETPKEGTKPNENKKPSEKPTTTTPQKEKPKEQVVEKVTDGGDVATKDWKGTITKISKENTDQQAKIRKLTTLNEQYVRHVTDKEVQQFQKTLMDDFVTGNFTNAIGDDQAMLTYIFKTYIAVQKTSKQNNYSLFMFMTTFQKFLEDIYLIPNTFTDEELDKRIDKLYQIYSTIE